MTQELVEEDARMVALVARCADAGWATSRGDKGYILRPPKRGGRLSRPFTIPLFAPDDGVYGRAEKQVLLHGLEADEKKATPKKTVRQAKIDADREKNDARMAAAEQRVAAQNAAAAPPAAPVLTPERIPAAQFTPAAALERLGLGNLGNANGNGNGSAAKKAAAKKAAPPDPVDVLFPGQVVPDVLRGVAGLSSLEPDTDLSQILIDPDRAPAPGPMQVTVYQLVTPEIAADWLTREIGVLPSGVMLEQRPITAERVTRYTGILQRDIKAQREGRPGEWDVAEDLKLAPLPPRNTGGAINGRHRLTTIRDTGISAIVKVTYNTAPRLYRSLDQGKMRTTNDNLRAGGHKNVSHRGSAGKTLFCWQQWQLDPLGPFYNWRNWPRMAPTDAQLLPWLADQVHPITRESLIEPHFKPGINMMLAIKGIPAAGVVFRIVVTAAWAAANPDGSHTMPEKGQAMLDKFCTGVQHGWDMKYGNPADTVRKWIERGSGGVKRNEKREYQLNGLLRAWEAFAKGEEYKKMQVNEDGAMPNAYVPSLRTASGREAFGLPPRA